MSAIPGHLSSSIFALRVLSFQLLSRVQLASYHPMGRLKSDRKRTAIVPKSALRAARFRFQPCTSLSGGARRDCASVKKLLSRMVLTMEGSRKWADTLDTICYMQESSVLTRSGLTLHPSTLSTRNSTCALSVPATAVPTIPVVRD